MNEIDDNDTDGDDRRIDDYDVRFSYEGRGTSVTLQKHYIFLPSPLLLHPWPWLSLGFGQLLIAAPGAPSRPTILTITTALSSTRKRSVSQLRSGAVRPQRRQQGTTNDNDDEILYSPTNSSISGGSSFNFTYRADDNDTDRVLVGLIRAYTVGVNEIAQSWPVRMG